MLRVGRIEYNNNQQKYPVYEGFTSIVVMMKSHSIWHPLSPYSLKYEQGQIFENVWQFSKCYETVPKSTQKYSRFNNTIIWDHPAERHIKDNKLTAEYCAWRAKGMNNKWAVRYPVGYHHRHKCVCAIWNNQSLSYIESRKKIYVPEYCRLVKKLSSFRILQMRLNKGENLLIIEIDGPHQESMDYYKEKYNVGDDFIQGNTILINQHNIKIMLNDVKHPFGHGYCLAMALLGKEEEWNN